MASGTPSDPAATRKMLRNIKPSLTGGKIENNKEAIDKVAKLGMSRRQQELNHLWARYSCARYDSRRMDWNGKEILDPLEHEVVATAGFLPPGFYDAGESLPIKFRKPTAPYGLDRAIVNRFTGLLFSERRHPRIRVLADPDTESWLEGFVEQTRLWAWMMFARTHGGAMGVTCVGFKFLDGEGVIEVHDPRWVVPEFKDRTRLVLKSIEIRYMYAVEERDQDGVFIPMWYWYRRTIDETSDTVYKPALVLENEEPVWQVEGEPVEHGFGFCPVVWAQNLTVQDDIDGAPDCVGIYDTIDRIDILKAQADTATVANMDPTVVISSTGTMADVAKGSNNAIKLPADGKAGYMEINAAGIAAARELAKEFKEDALEVASCVLENPDVSSKTATEVERKYAAMTAQADILREQYGQKLVIPLLKMVIKAARLLGEGKQDAQGNIVKQAIMLPPKATYDKDGKEQGVEERKLGDPSKPLWIQLAWPRYFEPTLFDVSIATVAAANAKTTGLVDKEHAVRFVADLYHVDNVDEMIERIDKEQKAKTDAVGGDLQQRLLTARTGMGGGQRSGGAFGGEE